MKITPIGIYGAYPAANGASGCYLVENNNTRIVLDMGSGALSRLRRYIDPALINAFVITHLHYDHYIDILPLSYYPGRHTVYCPSSPSDRFTLIKSAHSLDVRVIGEGLRLNIGDVELTFTRTAHGVETYAVKVSEGEKSFVYTSDTVWFDGLSEFCKGSELVLADCCFPEGAPHMTPEDGERLCRESGAKVKAIHLDPAGGSEERLRRLGIDCVREGETIILW